MVAIAAVQSVAARAFGASDPAVVIEQNVEGLERLLSAVAENDPSDLVVLPQGALQGVPTAQHDTSAVAAAALTVDAPELARLAVLADSLRTYVALGFYERDAAADALYSAALVVGPDGFRLSYRQMTAPGHPSLSRPALDRDGDAARLFPTAATPFGRIGCLIGADVDGFHVAKAHVFQGAELLLHSSCPPPTWRRAGRMQAVQARAYESLCGVASASLADPLRADESSTAVVDWTGRTVAQAAHCGPGYIVARMDLEDLRGRRRRHSMNFVSQTRTDLYARGFSWVAAAP